MRHIMCIDIETKASVDSDLAIAPFLDKFKTKNKLDPMKVANEIAEKKEKISSRAALSPVAGYIYCIGVLEISIPEEVDLLAEGNNPFTQTTEKFTLLKGMEKDIIREFLFMTRPQTEYVTFNGRGFDFTYIMFRAAIHKIAMTQLPIGNTRYNSRDNHYDMMIYLNDISGLDKLDSSLEYISLGKWMNYFGVGEKLELDDLDARCESDVRATYKIFSIFDNQLQNLYRRFPYSQQ